VIATTVGFREAQRAPGELGNSAIWQLGNPGDRQRIVRSRNWGERGSADLDVFSPRGTVDCEMFLSDGRLGGKGGVWDGWRGEQEGSGRGRREMKGAGLALNDQTWSRRRGRGGPHHGERERPRSGEPGASWARPISTLRWCLMGIVG